MGGCASTPRDLKKDVAHAPTSELPKEEADAESNDHQEEAPKVAVAADENIDHNNKKETLPTMSDPEEKESTKVLKPDQESKNGTEVGASAEAEMEVKKAEENATQVKEENH